MKTALLLLPISLASRALGQEPIETRIHRSIALPFLRLDPRGAPLVPGEKSVLWGFTSSNDLKFYGQGRFVDDEETERLFGRFRWGKREGEWQVEVPILVRGGGFMDPLIEWWHENVVGVHNLRSRVPYGRSEVIVPGSGRFGSAAGLGDVSVGFTRAFANRTYGTIAVKLPTGGAGRLLGSGSADGAGSLYYQTISARWSAFAQLGVVAQGRANRLESARGLVHQESLAVTYRLNRRDTLIGQLQGEASALVTGVSPSDQTQRMVSLGFGHGMPGGGMLQLFFSEDGDWLNFRVPEIANIAPDFSIGVRYKQRF